MATIMKNGKLVQVPDASLYIPPTPEHQSLEQAQDAMINWVDSFTLSITGKVPQDEKLSWDAKEGAARAILAGNATTSQTALLQGEADLTGETLTELSTIIVAKADKYRLIVAKVAGLRRAVSKQLQAADVVSNPFVYDTILEQAQTQAQALAAQVLGG